MDDLEMLIAKVSLHSKFHLSLDVGSWDVVCSCRNPFMQKYSIEVKECAEGGREHYIEVFIFRHWANVRVVDYSVMANDGPKQTRTNFLKHKDVLSFVNSLGVL